VTEGSTEHVAASRAQRHPVWRVFDGVASKLLDLYGCGTNIKPEWTAGSAHNLNSRDLYPFDRR